MFYTKKSVAYAKVLNEELGSRYFVVNIHSGRLSCSADLPNVYLKLNILSSTVLGMINAEINETIVEVNGLQANDDHIEQQRHKLLTKNKQT